MYFPYAPHTQPPHSSQFSHPNPYGLANTHVPYPSPSSVALTSVFGPNAPSFSQHQLLFLQQHFSGALGINAVPPTTVANVRGQPLQHVEAGPTVHGTHPLHESTPTSSAGPFNFGLYGH